MTTEEMFMGRRSVRNFKPDMVDDETLKKIAEIGTFAPTGRNSMSPIIIVVKNKELRDKISKINGKIMGADEGVDPFYGAPVIMIVLADKKYPTYLYDGSLVMGNLLNGAYSLGVDSCWIHRAKEEFETDEYKELLKSLGVEGDFEGIGHCALGYRADDLPAASPRKDDYVYFVD